MKIILIFFFSLSFLFLYSQEELKDVVKKEVKDQISDLKKRGEVVDQNDINQAKDEIGKKLNTTINEKINAAINELQNSNSYQSLMVDNQNKTRKELIECTGDYSVRMFILINAILTSFEQSDIQQDILSLNNPSDNALGFTLKDVMNQMVQKLIIDKMGNKISAGEKVSSIVTSIIENPLTKVIGSAVPVINNVINFVSSLAISNKRITPEDLKEFMKKIDDYFKFYELLSENNKNFKSNMYELKIRGEALKIILENFIIERARIFYEGLPKEDLVISKILSEYFTETGIRKQYIKLTKTLPPSGIYDLTVLIMPSTTASQAQYLIDEIESLANQYVNAYRKYIGSVNETLEAAKSLKDYQGKPFVDSKTVEDKKKVFENKLEKWEASFRNSLGIKAAKDVVLQMTQ